MSSGTIQIAVIGGGASGTITTIQLLRKLNANTKIFLIEKSESSLSRGIAYSSNLEYEPLNVHAGKMSIFGHLPDHFFRWIRENKDAGAHRESFVSRRWFGDYLGETFDQQKQSSHHILVETIIDEVTGIDNHQFSDTYKIRMKGGQELSVDYIVFATGNEAPLNIFNETQTKSISSLYTINPWSQNTLHGLQGDEHILILGTGLTMVDYVISLYERKHAGKIYCFSRNGYLPLPHDDEMLYSFSHSFESKNIPELFKTLRSDIKIAKNHSVNWQSVIDALRPRISRIWRNMNEGDKIIFLKRFKGWWEIHRHRIPQNSYKILKQMISEGQLEIIHGKFDAVKYENPFARFSFTSRKNKNRCSILLNRIINCTGPSGDYYKTENTLFKNLLTKGWMKQDEFKLGIVTGIRGEIIRNNGVVLQNVFSIGPVRKASEWESTAIREIRIHAEQVSEFIADRISKSQDILAEI